MEAVIGDDETEVPAAAERLVDVVTDVVTRTGAETLHERETIVFARQSDRSWLAVHEHRSPVPAVD